MMKRSKSFLPVLVAIIALFVIFLTTEQVKPRSLQEQLISRVGIEKAARIEIPWQPSEEIERVASRLVRADSDDLQKVSIFYEWLVANFDYNSSRITDLRIRCGDPTAAEIIDSNRFYADCAGFTYLLLALSEAAGVRNCRYVVVERNTDGRAVIHACFGADSGKLLIDPVMKIKYGKSGLGVTYCNYRVLTPVEAIAQHYANEGSIRALQSWRYKDNLNPLKARELIEEAEELLKTALAIDKRQAKALAALGLVYLKSGRLARAEEALLQSIKCQPDFFAAYDTLGTLYDKKGKHQKAIECYRKSISLNPDVWVSYDNLGNLYTKRGEFDKAISCYKAALAHSRHQPEVLMHIGVACYKRGFYEESLMYYKRLLEKLPHDSKGCTKIAETLYRLGNLKEARRYWEKAYQLDSENTSAKRNAMLLKERKGKERSGE